MATAAGHQRKKLNGGYGIFPRILTTLNLVRIFSLCSIWYLYRLLLFSENISGKLIEVDDQPTTKQTEINDDKGEKSGMATG